MSPAREWDFTGARCRPGPRSSENPAGPGGRGRGGGPGRPHLPPEAQTPAGPLPWRPRRPAQPLRQPAAQRSEERSLQPQTPDLGDHRTGHGGNQEPTGKWEGGRRGAFSSRLGALKGWRPAASPRGSSGARRP